MPLSFWTISFCLERRILVVKHDYGHLNCPFYQETLDNKVTVYFIPKKTELKSATIYIGQGGFLHSKEIASSKIPFGTAYYLMNLILPQKLQEEMKQEGVLAHADLDYSYVRYNINTLGDLYSPLSKLLNRISNVCYDKADVDALKEKEKITARVRENNPVLISQQECLDNLYFSSPIRYGFVPSVEDGIRIHQGALKKYQETYYVPSNIVLFISCSDDVEKVFEEVKKMKILSKLETKETPFVYEEIYDKVNHEYKEIPSSFPHSYLTYGIKFPSRAIIYDTYGELPFAIYEILVDSICKQNKEFMNQLVNLRANLIDTKLKEGGEDTFLLLTFQTEDEIALIQYLTQYFSTLDKRIDNASFKQLQELTFAKAVKELSMPNHAVDAFSRTYPNHVIYSSLIDHVNHINYGTYRRFLLEFKSFKKAVCYIRKGH